MSSAEIANQVFEKNWASVKLVVKGNAAFTAKLLKRLHLDPLCWLLEKKIFSDTVKENLKEVTAFSKFRVNERKLHATGERTIQYDFEDG